MVVRGKVSGVSLVAALIIMILALVYTAVNRAHQVAPSPPLHDTQR